MPRAIQFQLFARGAGNPSPLSTPLHASEILANAYEDGSENADCETKKRQKSNLTHIPKPHSSVSALRVAKLNAMKSNPASDIRKSALKLLGNRNLLERLLVLEKSHRGLSTDRVAFVGVANIAEHWWCTQKAVLKSRLGEYEFFATYLYSRINCAHRLGLIKKLPGDAESLLDIGHELTLADRQKLFESEEKGVEILTDYKEVVDKSGKLRALINPDLPAEQEKGYAKIAEAKGAQVVSGSMQEDPLLRGERAHLSAPEKYPAFLWAFSWKGFTVVGIPDGLTEQFVYEYKTTRNRYLFNFLKPVALAQADLYGHFFRRPRKRVQIHIIQEGKIETFEDPINGHRAEETLDAFARVERGEPAYPPKSWKCRNCEFNSTCSISQSKGGELRGPYEIR